MISKITRSGHVVAQKENNYIVEGDLPPELLEPIFNLVESWYGKDEVKDQVFVKNATDDEAIQHIELFDWWKPDVKFTEEDVGKKLRGHNEQGEETLFRILQPHTSQEHYPPYLVPAHYLDLIHHEPIHGEHPQWNLPSGKHDAYVLGDIVQDEGKVWICNQVDAEGFNVWKPGVFGWIEYVE